MLLREFRLKVNGDVRRFVNFKFGLNLVTNKPGAGRTGNSVGKSTLSRVIDFLFLGSLAPIYIDEEFKQPNQEIELFFKSNLVIASLDFQSHKGVIHQIARNLTVDSDELYYIDTRAVDRATYERFIQQTCFGINTRRPSVRSVMPKFIRNDSHRMLSTTKFLDSHSGAKDYSELFLYLFGFSDTELLTRKRDTTSLVTKRKRNSTSLNSMVTEQSPLTEITQYAKAAKQLETELLRFDYSPEYSDPVARLTELQGTEDRIASSLLSVERKLENIQRTVDLLSENPDGYLIREVREVYSFAGVSVEGALRSLEEVLAFHNNLVGKKKQFLTTDVPELKGAREVFLEALEEVRKNKLDVFSDMRSTESINNITENLKRLGELKVEIGKLKGLVDQQSKAKEDLRSAEKELSMILEGIASQMKEVELFVGFLNIYFKQFTKALHAEEYGLEFTFNESSGVCSVAVDNAASNPEGGKKKAEVIAFDFSYIHAVVRTELARPRFIFHDSIEDIDKKQIEQIFSMANQLPGQQILSMLSDKIDSSMYAEIKDSIVLELSDDDRFFGV